MRSTRVDQFCVGFVREREREGSVDDEVGFGRGEGE